MPNRPQQHKRSMVICRAHRALRSSNANRLSPTLCGPRSLPNLHLALAKAK